MVAEPQLALIRTDAVGVDFYDKVIARIDRRSRQPRGIALHFAGTCADELFVVTVYRDATSRAEMFTDFTGPEIANELHESGTRADISRHEYELHRLLVADSLVSDTARSSEEPWSALFVVDPAMTTDIYARTTALAGFPERWPRGLQVHLLFSTGQRLGIFDIWNSKALADSHYKNTIAPSTEESLGRPLPEGQFENGWIDVHSLKVNLSHDDPMRDFSSPELAGST